MNRTIVHSRVGADGVLKLTVPMDALDAGREVQVTIEPADSNASSTSQQEEWRQFIRETAGAWKGDLERPDQGDYEKRDELP
jgi:hypothetical protein